MVLKLWITGHVHDRSNQKINAYYHWPKGVHPRHCNEIVDKHKIAFSNISSIYYHDYAY